MDLDRSSRTFGLNGPPTYAPLRGGRIRQGLVLITLLTIGYLVSPKAAKAGSQTRDEDARTY